METFRKKKFRWNYIIYPKFQFSLILLNIAMIVGACAPILVSVLLSFRRLEQMGTDAGISGEHIYFKFLGVQRNLLTSYIGISLLCGILISMILSVYISHKVAGPLVRLRNFFRQMADTGQVSKVEFRKGDFFGDIPIETNRAIERITRHS